MKEVLRRDLHLPVVLYTSQSRVWGTLGGLLVESQEGKARSDFFMMYDNAAMVGMSEISTGVGGTNGATLIR